MGSHEWWDRIRQATRAADAGEPEALQALCDELAARPSSAEHNPGPPPAVRLAMSAPVTITPETADEISHHRHRPKEAKRDATK